MDTRALVSYVVECGMLDTLIAMKHMEKEKENERVLIVIFSFLACLAF